MGRVVEKVKLTNWRDLERLAAGTRREPPRVVGAETLVDTGAGRFYSSTGLVKKLGLRAMDPVCPRTLSPLLKARRVCSTVGLRIAGRTGVFRVV